MRSGDRNATYLSPFIPACFAVLKSVRGKEVISVEAAVEQVIGSSTQSLNVLERHGRVVPALAFTQ